MKKLIAFTLILSAFISVNAQNYLFDGIYSGMTLESFNAYCSENYEYTEAYLVTLDDNSYYLDPLINSNQIVAALIFSSYYQYGENEYNGAMLNTVNQLKTILESLNYEITFESWPLMKDIEVHNSEIIYSFRNGPLQFFISIRRLSEDYCRLIMGIYDDAFAEENLTL